MCFFPAQICKDRQRPPKTTHPPVDHRTRSARSLARSSLVTESTNTGVETALQRDAPPESESERRDTTATRDESVAPNLASRHVTSRHDGPGLRMHPLRGGLPPQAHLEHLDPGEYDDRATAHGISIYPARSGLRLPNLISSSFYSFHTLPDTCRYRRHRDGAIRTAVERCERRATTAVFGSAAPVQAHGVQGHSQSRLRKALDPYSSPVDLATSPCWREGSVSRRSVGPGQLASPPLSFLFFSFLYFISFYFILFCRATQGPVRLCDCGVRGTETNRGSALYMAWHGMAWLAPHRIASHRMVGWAPGWVDESSWVPGASCCRDSWDRCHHSRQRRVV